MDELINFPQFNTNFETISFNAKKIKKKWNMTDPTDQKQNKNSIYFVYRPTPLRKLKKNELSGSVQTCFLLCRRKHRLIRGALAAWSPRAPQLSKGK